MAYYIAVQVLLDGTHEMRNRSFGTGIMLRARRQETSLLLNVQADFGAQPTSCTLDIAGLDRQEREALSSPLSSTEAMKCGVKPPYTYICS